MNWLVWIIVLAVERCVAQHLHELSSTDIDGKKFEYSALGGKVLLVVNVASECGYTDSHYTALQKLHKALHSTGKFTVIGYPCNQFGHQEPGQPFKIKHFAQRKYSVTFPLMGKVDVIGESADTVWKYIVKASGVAPTWNFFKYLIDGNGDVIEAWGPDVSVESIADQVRHAVEQEHQGQMERPGSAYDSNHDEL